MRQFTVTCLVLVSVAACGSDREARDPYVETPQSDMGSPAVDAGEDVGEAVGCDSEDGPCELTCEVLLDPTFCWNVGVAQAYECLPDTSDGVMAADGLSCSDGDWAVAFAMPVIEGTVIDRDLWDFSVSRGGESCAEFVDSGDEMTLTTASSKTLVSVDNDLQLYEITCDDADTWQTADALALGSCLNEAGNTNLPGRGVGTIGSQWSFQLLPEAESLFQCRF